MKLFIITFTLLAIAFAGIAIKIWAKKGGEFSGTCASQNPFLNKDNQPVAIVENCLQSKIAVLTHSITKPLSSLPI